MKLIECNQPFFQQILHGSTTLFGLRQAPADPLQLLFGRALPLPKHPEAPPNLVETPIDPG